MPRYFFHVHDGDGGSVPDDLGLNLPDIDAARSAAIDLSRAKLPRSDIRRIILMDHDLIISPSKNAHVVADGLRKPIVLHLRDEQIFAPGNRAIALGEHVTLGDFSFVLTAG